MTQKNGMPIKFQLIDKQTGEVVSNSFWTIDCSTGKPVFNEELFILRQAIGATSSDDPPQELHFGDLIEFEFEEGQCYIGEIFWYNADKQVFVKLNQPHQGRKFIPFWLVAGVKKLGSRYDPKMKEILRKAGLEKS